MADHLIALVGVGPDRKGLLAELTGALVPLAVYHGDPRTTHLPGGNLAFALSLRTETSLEEIEDALADVAAARELHLHVHELADRTNEVDEGHQRYILRIRTAGRPGVLAEFSKLVARYGGTILDFGTRIGGGRVSVLRVELVDDSVENVEALRQELYGAAEQMGVGVKFYDTAEGENPLGGPVCVRS